MAQANPQNTTITTQPGTAAQAPTHTVVPTHESCCWGFMKKEWTVVEKDAKAAATAIEPFMAAAAANLEQNAMAQAAAVATGQESIQAAGKNIAGNAIQNAANVANQAITMSFAQANAMAIKQINELPITDVAKTANITCVAEMLKHATDLSENGITKIVHQSNMMVAGMHAISAFPPPAPTDTADHHDIVAHTGDTADHAE